MSNKPTLYLIIGVPGSGKTTYAKELAIKLTYTLGYTPKIYEADMFFNRGGNYQWKPEYLGHAHKWCQQKVENELKKGYSVICSNTSIYKRDRKYYIDLAKKYKANIEVITCSGNFKNIHGVPDAKVELMKRKFEPFTKDELI